MQDKLTYMTFDLPVAMTSCKSSSMQSALCITTVGDTEGGGACDGPRPVCLLVTETCLPAFPSSITANTSSGLVTNLSVIPCEEGEREGGWEGGGREGGRKGGKEGREGEGGREGGEGEGGRE